MTEKLINSKPNGVFALILIELTLVLGVFIFIMGAGSENIFGIIIGPLLIVIAALTHAGLKVVKPQEALVLTLFGNYTDTIKEPGFYFVNPFSVAVNPANHTRLGQSSDVSTKSPFSGMKSSNGNDVNLEIGKKQISLKVMTLSNSRQKINDCLGNPVEIGIAVTWRVVDTAKAVFNVDNYKEYLSLQCDSALRNIIRIYPYDVSSNGKKTENTYQKPLTNHLRLIFNTFSCLLDRTGEFFHLFLSSNFTLQKKCVILVWLMKISRLNRI